MRPRGAALAAPVGFALLLLPLFWPAFFGGRAFFDGDVAYQDYPWAVLLATALREGRLPWWSPELGGGYPLPAIGVAGVLYPLHWMLFTFFPAELGFELGIALHLWIAAIGTYGLLRALGASRLAAVLGGCCAMWCGPIIGRAFQTSLLRSAVWLPVGWWCVARGHAAGRWLACAGAAAGMSWLAGHPQVALYVTVGIGAYAGWMAAAPRARQPGRVRLAAAAQAVAMFGAVAAGVGAAQWIATLEFMPWSLRAGSMPFAQAAGFSLPPRQMITLVAPRFFGFASAAGGTYWGKGNFWELSIYLGLVPLMLLPAAWKDRRWPVRGFFAIGGAALILAMGKYAGALWLLQWLPLFNRFKNPERWGIIAGCAAAVLGGLGADALRRHPAIRRWLAQRVRMAAAVLLVSAGALWVVSGPARPWTLHAARQYYSAARYLGRLSRPVDFYMARLTPRLAAMAETVNPAQPAMAWTLALMAAALALARGLSAIRRPEAWLTAALAVTVVDLGVFAAAQLPTRPSAAVVLPAWLRAIDGPEHEARLLTISAGSTEPLAPNVFSLLPAASGLELINPPGASQAIARNSQAVAGMSAVAGEQVLVDPVLACVFGVTHILSVLPVAADPELIQRPAAQGFLYEHRNPSRRARWASQAEIVAFGDEAAVFARLAPGQSEPHTVVVERAAGQRRPSPDPVRPGARAASVIWLERRPERHTLRVDAPARGLLIVAQSWYPGWRALVDGARVDLYRAEGLFQAVEVPAGTHEVSLQYRPLWTLVGLAISALTAAGLALVFAIPLMR